MIKKGEIKLKAEELNIPFTNLLSAVACESVLELLVNGKYGQELSISNGSEFSIENYRQALVSRIYLEYEPDYDEKFGKLYMKDVLKDLIKTAASQALIIDGKVDIGKMTVRLTIDEMYVPIIVYFSHRKTSEEGDKCQHKLTMYDRTLSYTSIGKEEEIVKHLSEIIEKLELINDMDHYLEACDILTSVPLDGRKVKDRLAEILKEKNVTIDDMRMNMIKSYADYSYMKKKWKVELRQKKRSQPTWEDTIDIIVKFLEPIWDSMEKGHVFLGDWMPQLKRYLD